MSQAIHACHFFRILGQSSPNVAYIVEKPSVLNKFFQNYNILPRSGVRAESLRAGSENMPNCKTFANFRLPGPENKAAIKKNK